MDSWGLDELLQRLYIDEADSEEGFMWVTQGFG